MRLIGNRISVLVAVFALCTGPSAADHATNAAVRWLGSAQSSAGAIGGTQAGLAETAVAAAALRAAGARGATYYRALTYLENHAGGNVDFESRRILALAPHGASLGGLRAFLADARRAAGSGTAGWGLSRDYAPSALDTALALSVQRALAATEGVDEAIGFLTLTQRAGGATDAGWALQLGGGSDRIVTASVLAALAPFEAGRPDLTPSLVPLLDAAAATLAALAGSAADPLEIALAVKALAAAHRQAAPMQSLAETLRALQRPDGSWAGDVLTTAIAVEALVASGGEDTPERFRPVAIPDAALRRAINRQLGRNAMDALNRDELAQLAELSARGLGIVDLTGLEWATNLRTADLRDNAIAFQAPLDGLTGLATVLLAGNPVAAPQVAATVSWQSGLSLIAYPHRVAAEHATCREFLGALGTGDSGAALMRFDPASGRYQTCTTTGGIDYPVVAGEGYVLRPETAASRPFDGTVDCHIAPLTAGLNLRGHPLPAAGLTCFAWLAGLGPDLIGSIQRLDPATRRFQTCAFDRKRPVPGPVGTDFAVRAGEGYRLFSPHGGAITVSGCD